MMKKHYIMEGLFPLALSVDPLLCIIIFGLPKFQLKPVVKVTGTLHFSSLLWSGDVTATSHLPEKIPVSFLAVPRRDWPGSEK